MTFHTDNRTNFDAVYVGTGSKEGQIIREEVLKLISDGLERKSISLLEDLLSSSHPEQMVCLMSTCVAYSKTCKLCNWGARMIDI